MKNLIRFLALLVVLLGVTGFVLYEAPPVAEATRVAVGVSSEAFRWITMLGVLAAGFISYRSMKKADGTNPYALIAFALVTVFATLWAGNADTFDALVQLATELYRSYGEAGLRGLNWTINRVPMNVVIDIAFTVTFVEAGLVGMLVNSGIRERQLAKEVN